MDWEPAIENLSEDTDSKYHVTEDTSGGEQGSFSSNAPDNDGTERSEMRQLRSQHFYLLDGCKGGNMRWGGVRSHTSKHSRTGDLPQSAVPNTIEFAYWIGRTKQKKIRVTGKTKRPVPLEHCLFYSGELYKVCENEQFVPQGFKAAKDVFKKKNTSSAIGGTGAFHGSSSAANDRSRGQRPD
nr:DExH-box ATP-dependent RNA helicase DExH11 isoform X2 [Ipomoea batatas]GME17855.1 DExH-box ATP-dependent RNA helicase DExH11 isoform X2 [Ipomoea batatas]